MIKITYYILLFHLILASIIYGTPPMPVELRVTVEREKPKY